MPNDQPHLSDTDARAGEKHGVVRYVLIISLLLAVLVVGAVAISYR